jgi:penicillin-binding protein 1C
MGRDEIPPLQGEGGEQSEPGGVVPPLDPHPNPPPCRGREFSIAGVLAILTGVLGLLVAPIVQDAKLIAPKPTPIVYDRNGTFLTEIGHETFDDQGETRRVDYGYWPLGRLPDRVVRATLALEDRRFAFHPGVDPLAMFRAAWTNAKGRHRSGASTIAMQVARMQDPAPRTFLTKLREAVTATALTWRYGRDAVLAHYLRLVPYGNGTHGIANAARKYFDKPVEDLSWAEIALLAAVPQSPTLMNPMRPQGLARAIRRGHRVIDALVAQRVVDAPDAALAHRQLAAMPPLGMPRRPDALHAILHYRELIESGRIRVDPSDPRIYATLDLRMQGEVTALARKFIAGWRGLGAEQVAIIAVERGTGRVLADVGSAGYAGRRGGALDFTRIQRSPGSTLKPFIYALALDRGLLKPSDTLEDLPEGASYINNADGHFLGPMLPRQALANSRNVPATNLLRRTGLETTFGFLHALGLHDIAAPAESFGLSLAIGSLPTTLEKLVRAYGAIADDGKLSDLTWIAGQRTRDPVRVMSTDSARLVTSFLADPMARLPSFPRYGPTEYPFPVALKTGTSQGYRDAWTVAWSRQYLVGVWIGRPDAGTMTRLSGVGSAARLAHSAMLRLHGSRAGDLDDASFSPPEGRVPVELCTFGGRSDGLCGQTLTEWVKPDEMPPLVRASLPADGERAALAMPAAHRAWAENAGFRVASEARDMASRLAVVAPENNSRIWINPDMPAQAGRIALKAVVEPKVPQIVWYVDGEPFALSDPDRPVYWPLAKGAHRFQIGLPLQPARSAIARVVVE